MQSDQIVLKDFKLASLVSLCQCRDQVDQSKRQHQTEHCSALHHNTEDMQLGFTSVLEHLMTGDHGYLL